MDELLEILEENARIPLEDLAKLTKREIKEVEKVIRKYEKEGIIVKYQTVINKEKLKGEKPVIALIEVRVIPQKNVGFDQIAQRIYRFPEVKTCYLLSGTYDLLLIVEGKDMHSIASFVAEKLAPLSNVRGTTTHFLLKTYKTNGVILAKDEKNKRLAITY